MTEAAKPSKSAQTKNDVITHRRKPPLPVDRGWAWMVMLGAFVNTVCLNTFVRALSMLFLPFIDRYESSATMASLALGLSPAMFALSSLLQPSILLPKFEVRTICLAGSLGNTFSIILIAYAPNIIVLVVAFAINGFSMGLVAVPQTTLISHYFKKRLSTATACSTFGLSIATIAGPAFTQALLESYGLQGAVLMLAGIIMQGIPASMLFRPVSNYDENDKEFNIDEIDNDEVGELFESNTSLSERSVISHDSIDFSHRNTNDHGSPTLKTFLQRHRRRASDSVTEVKDIEEMLPVNMEGVLDFGDLPADVTVESVHELPELPAPLNPNPESPLLDRNERRDSHSSNHESRRSQHTLDQSDKVLDHPDDTSVTCKDIEPKTCCQTLLAKIKSSYYAHPVVAILILSSALGIHTNPTFSYIPALGKEHGLTESETPTLMTVAGACDLFSKILIGLFADMRFINPTTLVFLAQLILGVSHQFVAFYQGLALMMLMQVILGLTIGVFYVMLPVITVDIMGKEYIPHVMSGLFLINGGVGTLDNMVAGILKDSTGSFNGTYNYFGAMSIFGGTLILMTSFLVKCLGREKGKKDEEKVDA